MSLKISKRNTLFNIIGLPLLGVGILLILASCGLLAPQDQNFPSEIFCFLGIAFCVGGFALLFSCAGVVLDKGAECAIDWWGIFIPLHKQKYCLTDFDSIDISYEPFSLQTGTVDGQPLRVFRARLTGHEGGVVLSTSTHRKKVQLVAERVANFLDIEVGEIRVRKS